MLAACTAGAEAPPSGGMLPLWMAGPASRADAPWRQTTLDRGWVVPPLGASNGALTPAPERRAIGNGRAIVTALMSALVPGAGQLRNGSTLRALGFFACEVGGWVAHRSFGAGAEEKQDTYGQFAERYWDYERYVNRAPDPDSCVIYACPCDQWSEAADAEIVSALERNDPSRFQEYVARDAYACGWDTPLSRDLYRNLWDDRQDLVDAKRWTGRLIFLNHLLAAVDAFIEARSLDLNLDRRTRVAFRVTGSLVDPRPEVRITRHLD